QSTSRVLDTPMTSRTSELGSSGSLMYTFQPPDIAVKPQASASRARSGVDTYQCQSWPSGGMSSCAIPPGMLNARRIDPSPSYRAMMRLSLAIVLVLNRPAAVSRPDRPHDAGRPEAAGTLRGL